MKETDDIFLETADILGARLCRDAIWAGNRCNWLGAASFDGTGGSQAIGYKACGPDLYTGTSGIAVYLAHLYAATGERVFRVTAEGAIRQALSRLDDFAPGTRIGFYTGLTGIAYVLNELAQIFDMGKFASMALLILEEISKDDPDPRALASPAGEEAVPALLKIHHKQPQDFILDLAVKHGEHLLDALRAIERAGSWTERPGVHCGPEEAHSLDRIGRALLELWHQTGENSLRAAAERSFQQQRHLSDAQAEGCSGFAECNDATCLGRHAKAGMARLRAFELLGNAVYLDEAQNALLSLTRNLSGPSYPRTAADFSLAQGPPAAADLLLYASSTLNDEACFAQAERVGRLGIELYGETDLPWPGGVTGGAETPNLMLGTAGIGYFYLRLKDPLQNPSLLLILSES